MRKIGKPYLDQGKMWQDVEFEPGDKVPEGNQFFDNIYGWIDNAVYEKWTQTKPSIYKRRIPVENKVQQNAKKNLPLLKRMLLDKAKIVKKDDNWVWVVNYPSELLKDGDFFEVKGEIYEWLDKGQIGPDKYTIFEALAEGKNVQFQGVRGWEDFNYFSSNCHFDAINHLYRIKPEEISDTVIKWTSVTNPPIDGRVVYVLHESGTIQTVQFLGGKFMDNGREMKLIRGWSYA